MTGAELKTLRESLGLTQQWVADQCNVDKRAVKYWETGERAVPEKVGKMLRDIDAQLWGIVAQAIEQIREVADASGSLPEQIDMVRYRTDEDLWRYQPEFSPLPATCHGMVLARLMHELEPLNVAVRIVYMLPDNYQQWLGDNPDSAAARAAWAAAQKM